jgi:hypothetical protein
LIRPAIFFGAVPLGRLAKMNTAGDFLPATPPSPEVLISQRIIPLTGRIVIPQRSLGNPGDVGL